MFLRCKVRRKDGKQHRYWSVVENTRVASGRVVQRHVLYLGEINDSQELAWRRSIEVLEAGAARPLVVICASELTAHRRAVREILKIARSFRGRPYFLAARDARSDFPRTGLCQCAASSFSRSLRLRPSRTRCRLPSQGSRAGEGAGPLLPTDRSGESRARVRRRLVTIPGLGRDSAPPNIRAQRQFGVR
jgi:hypothetical protein